MLNKHCRCCGTRWTSLASFVDDLALIPAGQLEDPNPALSLATFVHDCGEVLYVEQRRLDAYVRQRRLQQVARRPVDADDVARAA
jgi:hypothetical protein